MAVRISGKTIVLTRGDTLHVKVNIFDASGNIYVPDEKDSIRFALKETFDDPTVLIEKTIPVDTCFLHLDSSDTKTLEWDKKYVYDIQITLSDGTVDTFIPNGRFIVTEEVL